MKTDKLKRARAVFLALVPLLFLVTLKTHPTYIGGGDQVHYLLIAESLLDDGDLNMENQYPDRHTFIPEATPEIHVFSTRFHHLHPLHDIGLGVLMLPGLALAHALVPQIEPQWFGRLRLAPEKLTLTLLSYQSMLVTVALAFLFYFYMQRTGFNEPDSFWAALLMVLTPPVMTHGYLLFTEIYSAAFLLLSVLVYKYPVSSKRAVLFSLGVFALSWLHIKNLAVCGVLGVLWFYRQDLKTLPFYRLERIAPLVALTAAFLIRAWLNVHYIGSAKLWAAWDSQFGGLPLKSRVLPTSVFSYLFDRDYGLLFVNPLFWLLPAGLLVIHKKSPGWWSLDGIVIAVYALGVMQLGVGAGWSPSARHILPVVPLLWGPTYDVIRRCWESRRWDALLVRGLVIAAAGLSCWYWQHPRLSWVSGGTAPWMTPFKGLGFDGHRYLPSFFVEQPDRAILIGVYTLALLLITTALRNEMRGRDVPS